MAGVALVNPKIPFYDALGVPLVGGTLDVYLAGTTTRTNTWQDKAQTTLNTNPIVLDSRGECTLWADDALKYKFVLKNSAGVQQWSVDNISGATVSATLVNFIQAGSGAVSRTVQDRLREVVSVKDFGAVGDGVTDDLAAFRAAIASQSDPTNSSRGGTIFIPRGKYYLSDTLEISSRITLQGAGNGPNFDGTFGAPVALIFPVNKTGIRIYSSFDTPVTGTTGMYSELRDFQVRRTDYAGSGTAPAGTGYGVYSTATIYAENVRVMGFSQDGWYIHGNGAGLTGNSNLSQLLKCDSFGNRGYGIRFNGSDANACLIQNCDATSNGLAGFQDESFLGNTYVACHGAGNNVLNSPPFVDYRSTNINARNVYLGCYSEGGTNNIIAPSVVLGGVLGASASAGSTASPPLILGTNSYGAPINHVNESSATNRPYFQAGGQDASNTVFQFGKTDSTFYRVDYYAGGTDPWFRFLLNNSVAPISFPNSATMRAAGPLVGGLFYGDPFNNYAHSYASAAPASGTWVRGDIVYSNTPSASGFIGWVCVASGTPGTWKTWGAISA